MAGGKTSLIVQMGLSDRAVHLRGEGKTFQEIADELGDPITYKVVQGFFARVAKTVKPPAIRTQVAILNAQDAVQVGEARGLVGLQKVITECENNYQSAKNSGDEMLAGAWMKQWQDALDKLFKINGTYERARKQVDAEESIDKVTVVWNMKDGSKEKVEIQPGSE